MAPPRSRSGVYYSVSLMRYQIATCTFRICPPHQSCPVARSEAVGHLLLGQAPAAVLDLGQGCLAAYPLGCLHHLAGLQRLVDLEEVLDLQPVELGDILD